MVLDWTLNPIGSAGLIVYHHTMTQRCIVVGWGAVSRHMLRALTETSWYETAAVVDVRAEAVADARATHPEAAGFTDLAEALGQIDADTVIINTPSHLHYDQVVAALDAGRHVLVAKPITNDFEQASDLVVRADAAGVTLSVGQQMRYMRHYQAVARFVASGALGSIEAINLLNAKPRPNPGNLNRMDQPALYEMSCHHFDSLGALVPDQLPEAIACDGYIPSWAPYIGPSMVNAWIRYTGDLHVLYQGGFSSQAPNYELRLEGSRGALRCRGLHMSIDEMTNEFAAPIGDFEPADIDSGIDIVNPWTVFADVWHGYLNGGVEPPFSGRNNLQVVALLSAGIDSANSGGTPVPVVGNPRYASAFELHAATKP